jgi:hypothetical protein
MPMIVCMKCQLFFHPKKNGVMVEEGMPVTTAYATLEERTEWKPYKLWHADLLECRGCGDQIVAGFARQPYSEHYHPDYNEIKANDPPIVFVKDCC